MSDMPSSVETGWAKEMVVQGVDRYITELFSDPVNGCSDAASQNALIKQRNRVAKFLGIEGKKYGDFR